MAVSLEPWLQDASLYKLQWPSSTKLKQYAFLCRALYRDEQGGALIEAALVILLYFILIFGMMNVGIVLFAYTNTVYASKVAVRYAAVHSSASATPCTTNDVQNLIKPYLLGAPAGGITINSTWSPSNTVGSTFSVTVMLNFPTPLPFTNSFGLQTSTTAQGYIVY